MRGQTIEEEGFKYGARSAESVPIKLRFPMLV